MSKRKHVRKTKSSDGAARMMVAGSCAIVLLTLVAYVPAIRGGFVWDDDMYVTRNPLVTAPDGLQRIWLSLDSPSQYFPLVYTVFRIEHALWGFQPLGYHLVNVLLHIANALLIWLLLRRLTIRGAWIAAAIWTVHPVNVESVAWITELKNVLSTLFYLLTILAWMRFLDRSERGLYVAALGFCALALFAKTTACTIPAVMLIVLWVRGDRITVRRVGQVVPFAAMGLAMALVSLWWERNHVGTTGAVFAFTPTERVLIAGRAVWFYLAKLIWPARLAFSYPRWQIDVGDPAQYAWPVAFLIASGAFCAWRKTLGRGPLIAGTFFMATLAPMLGFFSLYTFRYTFVADHYQYLACVGPIALVAGLISGIRTPVARQSISALVLCVLALLTWRQASAYTDSETLWRDTIRKNPASSMAHNELAAILAGRGDLDEAEDHARNAVIADPANYEARTTLAAILNEEREFRKAADECRSAIQVNPKYAGAHTNLANALSGLGDLTSAEEEYGTAVSLTPGDPSAHYNLALCLAKQGRLTEAKDEFGATLALDPNDADAQRDLATTLRLLGGEGSDQ